MLSQLLDSNELWVVIAAALLLFWAVVVAYYRPAWIAGIALVIFTVESVFGTLAGVSVGGILLYPRDGVFLSMALAAALRLGASSKSDGGPGVAWWILAALSFLSLARGVHAFGANLAGNDFRHPFYLLSAFWFFSTQRPDARVARDILDLWIGAAVFLVLVGFLRIMGVGFGAVPETDVLAGGRALTAQPTLLIAQAALIAFFVEPLGSRWTRVPGLPYVFLVGVLVFRHRTVWAVTLVALILMWTVLRPERDATIGRFGRRLAGASVLAGILVVGVVGSKAQTVQDSVTQSVGTASGHNSTLVWRVEGWQALLREQRASASALVAGAPYGSGYHRKVRGATVEVSPHSWYVESILREGFIGFSMLLAFLLRLYRRGRTPHFMPRNLGALLTVSAMVFGIAYQLPETQGILLGLIALASAKAVSPASSSEERLAGQTISI